jgi:hypothetical protein
LYIQRIAFPGGSGKYMFKAKAGAACAKSRF